MEYEVNNFLDYGIKSVKQWWEKTPQWEEISGGTLEVNAHPPLAYRLRW